MTAISPTISRHQWTSFCEDLAMRTAHDFAQRFSTFSAALSSLANIGLDWEAVDGSVGCSSATSTVDAETTTKETILETVFKRYAEWFVIQLRAEFDCQLENLTKREDEKKILNISSPLSSHNYRNFHSSIDEEEGYSENSQAAELSAPRRSLSARLPSSSSTQPPSTNRFKESVTSSNRSSLTRRRSPSWLQTGSSFIREKISGASSSSSSSPSSKSSSFISTSSSSSKLSSSSSASSTSSSIKSAKIHVDVTKEGVLSYRFGVNSWNKVRLSAIQCAGGCMIEWFHPPSTKEPLVGLFACDIRDVVDLSSPNNGNVFKIQTLKSAYLFSTEDEGDVTAWTRELNEMRQRQRRVHDGEFGVGGGGGGGGGSVGLCATCSRRLAQEESVEEWRKSADETEEDVYGLDEFPWFHGNLSREKATKYVLIFGGTRNGLFLVRRSFNNRNGNGKNCANPAAAASAVNADADENYDYVLTFNCQGKAKHVRFCIRPEDARCKLQLPAGRWHDSIFDMLEHHRLRPIPLETTSTTRGDSSHVEDGSSSSSSPSPSISLLGGEALKDFVVRQRPFLNRRLSASTTTTTSTKITTIDEDVCPHCNGEGFRSRIGSGSSTGSSTSTATTVLKNDESVAAGGGGGAAGLFHGGSNKAYFESYGKGKDLWTHGGSVRRRLNSLEKQRLMQSQRQTNNLKLLTPLGLTSGLTSGLTRPDAVKFFLGPLDRSLPSI